MKSKKATHTSTIVQLMSIINERITYDLELWDDRLYFAFNQNGVRFKKITNLGKSCQFDTTSYAQIVPIRHDSATSYWSCANLARLLPCHTEVVPTWHVFP